MEMQKLYLLVPLAPLLGAVIAGLFCRIIPRWVAHSVTADSDAVLLEAFTRWAGELNRVAVEVGEPLGRFTGFRPLRTVTTWAATKS